VNNEVLALILGGGQGSRLFPLTQLRSKPAVPIAGKYRLIDIPVSNCLHADIRRIFVLTQFNSASLNRHISQTYRMDLFSPGFVEILAAEITPENTNWFQGTADAVRKAARHFVRYDADYYLILAGDHLYRMDYSEMVDAHIDRRADITIAAQPVDPDTARHAESIVRRPEVAADVLQEAFIQVWQNAQRYSAERGAGGAWLTGIVRFRALDAVRKYGREVLSDDPGLGDEAQEPDIVGRLAVEGEASALERCLGLLDEQQRRCVTLAFVDGFSHAEIAEHLAAPLGSAKSWVRRGLLALRSCLES